MNPLRLGLWPKTAAQQSGGEGRGYGCTLVHERTFAYPTTSPVYHVRQIELYPDELNTAGKAHLERYPSACPDLHG
jgi:hypothetical protein